MPWLRSSTTRWSGPTSLPKDPGDWWPGTPLPYNKDVDAAAVLGPVAERLLNRAAMILASTLHDAHAVPAR